MAQHRVNSQGLRISNAAPVKIISVRTRPIISRLGMANSARSMDTYNAFTNRSRTSRVSNSQPKELSDSHSQSIELNTVFSSLNADALEMHKNQSAKQLANVKVLYKKNLNTSPSTEKIIIDS